MDRKLKFVVIISLIVFASAILGYLSVSNFNWFSGKDSEELDKVQEEEFIPVKFSIKKNRDGIDIDIDKEQLGRDRVALGLRTLVFSGTAAENAGEKKEITNVSFELTKDKNKAKYYLRGSEREMIVGYSFSEVGDDGNSVLVSIYIPENKLNPDNKDLIEKDIYWAVLQAMEKLGSEYDAYARLSDEVFSQQISNDQIPITIAWQ